ncbi:MAG: hypothetical protein SF187_06560 [Deltaproteobacteria bacterium]|nr:hypothetical protein [Deltaproteobacteria bacterium]
MNYFVLLARTPWAGPTAFTLHDFSFDLQNGRTERAPPAPLRYELRVQEDAPKDESFPPCDLHDAGSGQLLMSPRMISALAEAGVDNIQFFDCHVQNAQNGEQLEYKVANVLGVVKALDVEASDCEIDEDGFVETFYSMKIDSKKAKGCSLFRLFETLVMVIISERVKIAIEGAGLTGIQIVADSDWEPGDL